MTARLSDFAKGDRVILARVTKEYARGRMGTVVRVVKSRQCVTVDIDDDQPDKLAGCFDAWPQNIDKVTP